MVPPEGASAWGAAEPGPSAMSGNGAAAPPRPPSLADAVLALAAAFAAVATGVGVASSGALSSVLFFTAAAVAALAVVAWGSRRIWPMAIVLLVVRPALDQFKSAAGTAVAAPGVIAGVLFMVASAWWLHRRWRQGLPLLSTRSTVSVAVLAAACVLSALTSDAPMVSAQAASRVVSTALMLVVLEQSLRDRPERLRSVLVAVFASLAVPGVVAAVQLAGNAPETPLYGPALGVGRIRGTFVHPNVLAAYLTVLLPLAVALVPHTRGKLRALVVVAGAASGFLLLFTYARGAWVAAFLAVVVVGWLQDRRIIALAVAAVAVLVMAVPSVTTRLSDLGGSSGPIVAEPDSLSWRIGYWKDVLPMTEESPVTGIGLNVVERRTAYRLEPHNVFVQALIETGVVGLGALVAFVVVVTLDLRRALRSVLPGAARGVVVGAAGAFVAFVVQCLSENLLTSPVVHWYLTVPLAWALSRLPARVPAPAAPSVAQAPAAAV